MFCSSGLSRLPSGSPYWIPISRNAAARPSSARRTGPAGPRSSNLRRRATDEVGDVGRADEDGIDPRPLEREHLVAVRRVQVGDRELAGRDVGEQIEDPVELVL